MSDRLNKQQVLRMTVAIGCLFIPFLSPLSYGQDWNFEFEPYALLTSIEGDTGVGRITGVPVDVAFDDILGY